MTGLASESSDRSSTSIPCLVHKLTKYTEALCVEELCEQVLASFGYIERINKVILGSLDASGSSFRSIIFYSLNSDTALLSLGAALTLT